MAQTREKWNSLVLSRADFWMVWRCHGIPYIHLYFLFRTNGKGEHLDENNFRHSYGNYFESAILKVTWYQLCSKFILNIYEAHWQRHLKDTLQLKILREWINIRASLPWLISWNENERRCPENFLLYEEHSIYYCILLFLSSKPSF